MIATSLMAVVLALAANSTPVEDPSAELARLKTEYTAQLEAWDEAVKAARSDAKSAPDPSTHPAHTYAAACIKVAKRTKGKPVAAEAYAAVIVLRAQGVDLREPKRSACDALIKGHIDSSAIETLAKYLQPMASELGSEYAEGALRKILAGKPEPVPRAAALFSLGNLLLASKVHVVGSGAGSGTGTVSQAPADAEKRRAEGLELLGKLTEQHADTDYAKTARSTMFELANLQIGQAAPDFEATDENGVAWKLSDYRGKVVVIDFWGIW